MRQLGVSVIDMNVRGRMCFRLRPCIGQPEAQVLEDLSDGLGMHNEADELETPLTVGTDQGVSLVHLLY